MRRAAWLVAAAVCVTVAPAVRAEISAAAPAALAVPPATNSAGERPVLLSNDWKSVVDFYRETAGLAHLAENAAWSEGARLHSQYMAANKVIAHDEVPGKPYYTAAGRTAAQKSNVFLGGGATFPDRYIIEGWMTGPFHASGIVDPALTATGYGVARVNGYTGGTLDVLRGLTHHGPPSSVVVWPGNGAQVPLLSYGGFESPDPLTFCPGYPRQTGLPILAMLPAGVRVTASSVTTAGSAVTHCRFDSRSSGDAYAKKVLAARNAVVVMPRDILKPYQPYTVSLQTTAGALTWSFTGGEVKPPTNVTLGGPTLRQPFQTSTTFPLTWSATDSESGVASYDVRFRAAAAGGSFGAPTAWQTGVAATGASFTGTMGTTYCFSARATDGAGNRSRWTPEQCTALPLSNLQLTPSALLWLPTADTAYYSGTASMALTPGSTLTIAAVGVRRIAVLVTKCAGCGSVDVTFRGTKLASIDLSASSTTHREVVNVGRFGNAYSGDLVISTTSALAQVIVEGVGLSPA